MAVRKLVEKELSENTVFVRDRLGNFLNHVRGDCYLEYVSVMIPPDNQVGTRPVPVHSVACESELCEIYIHAIRLRSEPVFASYSPVRFQHQNRLRLRWERDVNLVVSPLLLLRGPVLFRFICERLFDRQLPTICR